MSIPSSNSARASLTSDGSSSSHNLDIIAELASQRAMQYQVQMRDLESRLALDLSNSRAIDTKLKDVMRNLEQTQYLNKVALSTTVPHIVRSLRDDKAVLQELDRDLPEIGRQVREIRMVYDRGRDKAKELVKSLEWLDTPVPLRLRAIIFTPNAPVARKWKLFFSLRKQQKRDSDRIIPHA